MMKSNGVPTDWKSPAKDPRTRKKKGKEKTEKGGEAHVSATIWMTTTPSVKQKCGTTHTHTKSGKKR